MLINVSINGSSHNSDNVAQRNNNNVDNSNVDFGKKRIYRRYKNKKTGEKVRSIPTNSAEHGVIDSGDECNVAQSQDDIPSSEKCSQNAIDPQYNVNSYEKDETRNGHLKGQSIVFYVEDLRKKKPNELFGIAHDLAIESLSNMQKPELLFAIMQKLCAEGGTLVGSGTLEILQEGYGFLRSPGANYIPGTDDIYISPNQIRKNSLRTGDTVSGILREPKRTERYFAMQSISTINEIESSTLVNRRHFDDLTPLYPNKMLTLEDADSRSTNDLSSRIIDIITPLGKGQRALVVAPPRTGKTILIQNIAHAITHNFPEIKLIVLLIDERPEEVTDMLRSVQGEVVSSTFDEPSHRHVQLSEMVIEKSKRLVEAGHDVVILLDSITRLARAYNNISPSSGKVLSGGVDSNALQRPKRFFGAARNIEEGGSLTIIATALVETGSRMDEVIFEEFKGTGNSEIVLDRKLSDRRIFPAIDITKSGTRKEELLLDKGILTKVWILRKLLNPMSTSEAMEFLIEKLKVVKSNEQFFDDMDTYNTNRNKK